MLANSVIYMITGLAEMGIVLAWGIWIWLNKDDNDLPGCPICGDDKSTIAMFFFAGSYVLWWVIGVPIKIASAWNFQKYYDLRYKDAGNTSYSLGASLVDKDVITLVVIE